MKHITLTISIFLFSTLSLMGQEKIEAGKVYQPGDRVFAPFVGFEFVVPEEWLGILPQNTALFLFSYRGGGTHKIFTFSNSYSKEQILQGWKSGLELSQSLTVNVKGEPKVNENAIIGDLVVKGEEVVIGKAMALMGDYGKNVTFLAVANDGNIEPCITALDFIQTNYKFSDSRNYDQYEDIVWAEVLKKKFIYQYEAQNFYFENFELWLCADGTFNSKFKVKGKMKKYKDKTYKGKKKGTWTGGGTGQEGTLELVFTKAPPITFKVKIENDNVFFDTHRVFVSQYDCGDK